jgi:iron complex transport system substrate-binding protein
MRVISLCPSLSELVFDLGLGAQLVGVTKFCIHPAEGMQSIEKLGGTKDPNVERIIELNPDIVLLNREENRIEDAQRLQSAGLNCHVSMPRSVDETAEMVRSIATALERVEAGESIARDIEARSQRVRQAARGQVTVSWIYLIWRDPWMSVNQDTFVQNLLGQAGGRNAFAELQERYPVVEAQDIAAAKPDAIFLSSEPFPFKQKHIDELVALTGLPRERFHLVDGEYLSWHGSRTPDGVDYAAGLIQAARG